MRSTLRAVVAIFGLAQILGDTAQAQEGAFDPTFNPTDVGFGNGDGANGWVETSALQPDGKILIGGSFVTYNGAARGKIARTLANGAIDPSFTTGSGANASVTSILVQPDGKIIITGPFTTFNGTNRARIARLNADGSLDTTFDPGTGASGSIRASALQPDGKIIIGGEFVTYNGTSRPRIARLNANGSLDLTFNVGGSGALGFVYCLALRADGKIIIAGNLSSYNGAVRNKIARLNADGSLDTTFDPGTGANSLVLTCAAQPDGRVLVGGAFTTVGGVARDRFARLNADGSLDTAFDIGLGADNTVSTCALQTDGRVIVGGEFTSFGNSGSDRIVRLNANGSVDASFASGTGADAEVVSSLVLPDGKLILGGKFIVFAGKPRNRILRLNNDGSPDASYDPGNGANGVVLDIEHLSDGRIMIGGYFSGYNGQLRMGIARLEANGALDGSFDPGQGVNPYNIVRAIAAQPDGKIIIGGGFSSYGGVPRLGIARVNTDGTLDSSFDPGTGAGDVHDIAVQPDGKIIVVGGFTTYNGVARNRIARINTDGSLDGSFNPGSGAITQINSVELLSDGKIMIGGTFQLYNGAVRNRLARLNADGSLDSGFNPGQGPDATVLDMAVLPNGKLMIAGYFSTYAGVARNGVARVNANGTLDTGFDPGTGIEGLTYTCMAQPDGSTLVGGSFSAFNGSPANDLVKLTAAGAIDPAFAMGTAADRSIHALDSDSQGRTLIGGDLRSYNGNGRNRIARINGISRMSIRTMLEGPFNGGLMNDGLRTLPSFPLAEPFSALGYAPPAYTPGATIASSVLGTTGNNAIVDWVIVEMRPVATPGTIAAARAVLLQRDGDVVDLDGTSTVGFPGLGSGNYCIAIRSRNHLPVMSSTTTPVNYGSGAAAVDFTLPSTLVYDNDARQIVNGTMVLAAGDVNGNGTVQYAGNGNDRDPVLTRIGGIVPTNVAPGYFAEDVNMDGEVKYTGTGNDRDMILQAIGGIVPTNTRVATLP